MEPTEKSRRERFKVHFNFITLHCEYWTNVRAVFSCGRKSLIRPLDCYIIGMVLVLSVIIFLGSNMPYVDALFFACGACTQAGLNT